MLTLPRRTLGAYRAVLQRLVPARERQGGLPVLTIHGGPDGLALSTTHQDVVLMLQCAGTFAWQRVSLPSQVLHDLAGQGEDVTLSVEDGTVVVRAVESKTIVRQYQALGRSVALPALPKRLEANPPVLLQALHEAMALAAPQATRFAIDQVQLRKGGEVVGTDGRQLLLHGDFHFPWREAVLLPATKVFGCKEIRSGAPVQIGRTERHVLVRTGPWSVFLPADTTSRYPDVDSAIPRHWPTTWKLTAEAATQLHRALQKGATEDPEIRIELGAQVTVRTTGSAAVAIPVRPCTVVGKHLSFAVPVGTLLQALRLGFREFRLVDSSTPVLCPDGNRRFVFMPIAPTAPTSAARQLPAPLVPVPTPALKGGLMLRPNSPPTPNPPASSHPHADADAPSPLAAIVELQGVLRDALGKLNELASTLRHQQRQHKVVQNALGSLRRLRQL